MKAVVAMLGLVSACGYGYSGNGGGGGGGGGGPDASMMSDGGVDAAPAGSAALTCPDPGAPKSNGGSCGTERWSVKTGTDSQASSIQMISNPTTIDALDILPANGGGTMRSSPTETTIYQLTDVLLTEVKLESDSDYHLVITDGSGADHTMIAEIPYQNCDTGGAWTCFISRARSEVDAKYTVTTSPQYPMETITVRGVGFFDVPHGQTGVAPNAIELHPVLEICFGQGCTPD